MASPSSRSSSGSGFPFPFHRDLALTEGESSPIPGLDPPRHLQHGDQGGGKRSSDRRLVRFLSGDFVGVEGRPVEVQVHTTRRTSPGFNIVGLPGKPTRESRDRIQTALENAGYRFPFCDRITVNLAPAFRKKDTGVFDLPIALGVLLASGQVRVATLDLQALVPWVFLGELGLQSELRPVPGALLIALAVRAAGMHRLVVPAANAAEVACIPGLEIFAAEDLHGALRALRDELPAYTGRSVFVLGDASASARDTDSYGDERGRTGAEASIRAHEERAVDFAQVRGQEVAKLGLLIAAAGGHNALLVGPPGVGKSMLARRLPTILPAPSFEESLEILRIYSSLGLLTGLEGAVRRPFRAPHHTVSYAGLVGGGNPPRAGEISLAHRGVLFLDELPEFQRRVLETLRQPMESKTVTIARSCGSLTFPADFMLVTALNPCPCGFAGDPARRCRCTPREIASYRNRLSGPLLERIDVALELAAPAPEELIRPAARRGAEGMSSETMREHVRRVRSLQEARWGAGVLNADVSEDRFLSEAGLDAGADAALVGAARRGNLSARSLGRLARVARTVADFSGDAAVTREHVARAQGLRRAEFLDRG